MKCPDENLVNAFVQGLVSPAESSALEEHFDGCPACREMVASLARGVATLTTVGEPATLVGRTLKQYEIDREVGAGGMGVVYAARDVKLDRWVALKVLPPEVAEDRERRERFEREARAAARLSHPNIVTIHAVEEAEDQLFIVMELVKGTSLSALIARTADGLPIPRVIELATSIAEAVASAHDAGVVHRDLKPANILVTPEGVVKVLDFGLAKLATPSSAEQGRSATGDEVRTADGRILGTPAYMSPEQASGKTVDHRTDLFSLGVILYEMSTGTRPFSGDSTLSILSKVVKEAPVGVGELRSGVPQRLAAIVERCLAKEPSRRYPSARDVVRDLVEARAGSESTEPGGDLARRPQSRGSVAASSMMTPAPASLPVEGRKKRTLWLGVGLTVVAAAAATGVVLHEAGAPSTSSTSSASSASPLVAPESVLACPLLEAAGVEEPAAWLGATTAHLACVRATWMLGGDAERTLIPAQLLELPTELVDDYPRDPYCEPGAREKSIAAAKVRASAWLDGSVSSGRDGFLVQLRLVRSDGSEVGAGKGSARALYQAVRGAFRGLVQSGALPVSPRLEPRIARWEGFERTDLALTLFDFWTSSSNGTGLEDEFEHLEAYRAELGPLWPGIQFRASTFLGDAGEETPPPALDTSSPERLVLSAYAKSVADPGADRGELADRLAELRAKTPDRYGRATIANIESMLRYKAGQTERSGQVALSVAAESPRLTDWSAVTGSMYKKKGFEIAARAVAAWTPTNPDGWNMLGYGEPESTDEQRLRMFRRAVEIAPDLPLWSLNYAVRLLLARQPARARSLAARLSGGGPEQRTASELILAWVDMSNARFSAAYSRMHRAMMQLEVFGFVERADIQLVPWLLNVSMILGRETEVADDFAERFVLADPPRLGRGHFALLRTSTSCAVASRPVALRCFERLRKLEASNHFVEGRVSTTTDNLDASEMYAKGDKQGAVRAWRSLISAGSPLSDFASAALDAAGEHDLAEKSDAKRMELAAICNGASLAHVRAARRAYARKDYAHARELATTVVEAWSTADTKVAAVDEMRALLRKLPER